MATSVDPRALRYVLVTPAKNEGALIREPLEAMVSQTVLPLRWVIVSDGSTDDTDEIVMQYASRHSWIELLRLPARAERHFAGKVHAFDAGYARLRELSFEVVGNLDADVSFPPDYLEHLLDKFSRFPRLGVAGTNYVEDKWENQLKYDYRFADVHDVTGQCQLFRRRCFEEIGGYTPNRVGGVDLLATLSARVHGWETRVFTDRHFIHHRQQGTATINPYMVEYSNGRKDYLFGNHPVWEVGRAAYRLVRKPFFVGGCLVLAGYFWAMLTRTTKIFPRAVIELRRREQLSRLAALIRRLPGFSSATPGAVPSAERSS